MVLLDHRRPSSGHLGTAMSSDVGEESTRRLIEK